MLHTFNLDQDMDKTDLQELCRQKGLTLTDLANRMGTSPGELLAGIGNPGNPALQQEIAAALRLSAPAVQLPAYRRYDELRQTVRAFVSGAIAGGKQASIMGKVENHTVFALLFSPGKECFLLSLCHKQGETRCYCYDKYEYCGWPQPADDAPWDAAAIATEIINDLEG